MIKITLFQLFIDMVIQRKNKTKISMVIVTAIFHNISHKLNVKIHFNNHLDISNLWLFEKDNKSDFRLNLKVKKKGREKR